MITILRIIEIERQEYLLTPFKAWAARKLKIPVESRITVKANIIISPVGLLQVNMLINGRSGESYIVIGLDQNKATIASLKPQNEMSVNIDIIRSERFQILAHLFSEK